MGAKETPAGPFEYFAFISYSRKDSRIARWLHRKLEWYRFPSDLVAPANHPPHPKYIRPVVRDKSDLEVDHKAFWENIKGKLDKSRFLIVLCSRNAARSSYVSEEIRHFLANPARRDAIDYVVPIIVEGSPDAGDDTECLPEALRELGAGITGRNLPTLLPDEGEREHEAWENGLIQTVAYVLQVDRAKIADRYQRAKRQQNQRILAAVSMLVVILAALSAWALTAERRASIARAEAERQRDQVRHTLARADFEEATRLLDDRHETSRALAYIGSSLQTAAYAPARERLYGLLMERSWLIRRQSRAFAENDNLLAINDHINRCACFRGDTESGKGMVAIDSTVGQPTTRPTEIPVDSRPMAFFTADGQSTVLKIRNGNGARLMICRADTGEKTGQVEVASGAQLQGLSPTGRIAVIQTGSGALQLLSTRTGDRLGQLGLELGRQWLASDRPWHTGDALPSQIAMDFDEDDSLFVVADGVGRGPGPQTQFAELSSLLPSGKPFYRIRSFQIDGWKELLKVEGKGAIRSLRCSPAGNHVVYAASADTVEDWQVIAEPIRKDCAGWRKKVAMQPNRITFSPDAIHLAMEIPNPLLGAGGTLAVLDAFTGEETPALRELSRPVAAIRFSHDGRRLAILTQAPELRIVNLRNGTEAVEPIHLPGDAVHIGFSRDDCSVRVLSAGPTVTTYDLQISPVAPRRTGPSSQLPLVDATASPDGQMLILLTSGSQNGGVLESHALGGAKAGEPQQLPSVPNCLALSADGRWCAVGMGPLLATNDPGSVLLLEILPGTESQPKAWRQTALVTVPSAACKVAFAPDGKSLLVMGSPVSKGAVKLAVVEVATGTLLPEFIQHDQPIGDACWHSDGRLIATAASDGISVWDVPARKRVANSRLQFVPDALDIAPSGWIAVGANAGNRGEVRLLATDGKEIWAEPQRFSAAVRQVAFDPTGQTIAVRLRGRDVVILDAKTGRPRTAPLVHDDPVSVIRFAACGPRSVLCTGCEGTRAGTVEFWDPETGRRIGDRIKLAESTRGLVVAASGRVVAWDINAAVMANLPGAVDANASPLPDFVALCGELGGWYLNEWRAPEPFRKAGASRAPSESPWSRAVQWLQAPFEQRTLDPLSNIRLVERLRAMAEGSFEESQQALDIRPDFAPALAALWFASAREAAERTFMSPVAGKSARERLARQIEWNHLIHEQKASAIFNDLRARRMAEFMTRHACIKQPNSAAVWRERTTYLRLSGRLEEAQQSLKRAIEIDPADWESRQQLALLHLHRNEPIQALSELKVLCDQMSRNRNAPLEAACSVGELRADVAARFQGFVELKAAVDWLAGEVEQRAVEPLRQDQVMAFLNSSEKMSDLLILFPSGPAEATRLNLQLAAVIEAKGTWTRDQAVCAGLLANAALAALLNRDTGTALQQSQRAVELNKGMAPIQVIRAHALYLAGRRDEALSIYRSMLEADSTFGGLIARGLFADFRRFAKRGFDLQGLTEFRKELARRLASELAKGLLVKAVVPQGQADRAGIRAGDRIVEYQGEPTLDLDTFVLERQLEELSTDREKRSITVLRDGTRIAVEIQSGRLGIELSPAK